MGQKLILKKKHMELSHTNLHIQNAVFRKRNDRDDTHISMDYL